MTVTLKDGLFTFGTQEIVEIPNDTAGAIGGIASTNDATQKAPLGVLYRHKGNVYRYVQFDDGAAVTAVAGSLVTWLTLAPASGSWVVTTDVSGAIGAGLNLAAGILLGVVTDQYYTWIQVGGVATALVAAATAVGDVMTVGADKTFGRLAADASITAKAAGVALSAVDTPATGYSYVLLLGMIW